MFWLCVIGACVLFMLASRLGRTAEQWVLSGSEFDTDARRRSGNADSESADEEWAILLAATEEEHNHQHSDLREV